MSSSEQTKVEENLISEILNGKQDQYKILVERYSPMIFHVVRGFEKDEEEVRELAQQIFVKAYEKLSGFRKNAKFSSWLYSIAINHCRDYSKDIRRKNKRISEMNSHYAELSTDEKTPHLRLEMREWKWRLKQALEKLTIEYSEPFLMKYRDGMSYEAMSEQMDVSVSALKVRVHRARKELKEIIEKQV
ncbi:MAG: sigma-70 family RNA polymerase sigma factor [Balneolaceae bacterium]